LLQPQQELGTSKNLSENPVFGFSMRMILVGLNIWMAASCTKLLIAAELTDNAASRSEFVSEVIPVKYEKALVIAEALNSLGTSYTDLSTSGLICKNRVNVLSSAWQRLSIRFKENNSLRNTGQQVCRSGIDRIVADERTNSLLFCGAKEDLAILKETIVKLDVVAPQILIEGVIFEVSLSDRDREHRRATPRREAADARPTATAASNLLSITGFTSLATTNSSANASNSFFYVGALDGDLDTFVTELANNSNVRILQRPRIQTSDSEPASIFVGEVRPPYSGGTYYCCGSSPVPVSPGVTLEVNPHIQPGGSLLMDIHQTTEKAAGNVNIVNVGTVPITSRTEYQAQATAADRETIVLGGMIQSVEAKRSKKIPLIGLFRKTHLEQRELIVAIRPMILPPPEEVAAKLK